MILLVYYYNRQNETISSSSSSFGVPYFSFDCNQPLHQNKNETSEKATTTKILSQQINRGK
ncbi:hypothetical protein DERP_001986 [Dermatophagoides pteronyssinus]|uniref:Uncharacterized protein n=1 Tax=Dermatophagoides pteronyssinus TaxID=6956 RepID=A0ABQ8JCH2_DERPT|nr:hypothetical protein DERP_001986 [Dermatophagoides pteronyssinus]